MRETQNKWTQHQLSDILFNKPEFFFETFAVKKEQFGIKLMMVNFLTVALGQVKVKENN